MSRITYEYVLMYVLAQSAGTAEYTDFISADGGVRLPERVSLIWQ